MANPHSPNDVARATVLKKLTEAMERVNARLMTRSWFERRRDYSEQTLRDVKNWWNS